MWGAKKNTGIQHVFKFRNKIGGFYTERPGTYAFQFPNIFYLKKEAGKTQP